MEQEKTFAGKGEKADKRRAEKEVALTDAIRKIVKEELKKSERRPALDLALEKNTVDEKVDVILYESQIPSEFTNKIMNIVRKHAKNLLETKCPQVILENARKEFEGCQVYPIHITFTEWNGRAIFGMASIPSATHTTIGINHRKLVIIFLCLSHQ